jgi:hypothetical protein
MLKILESYENLRVEQVMLNQRKKSLAFSFESKKRELIWLESELKSEMIHDEDFTAQEWTKMDEDLLDAQKKLKHVEEILVFLRGEG